MTIVAPPQPPASPSEVWTLFCYDINTNTKLTEIPVQGLAFDTRLNDAGSISGNINLQSPGVAKLFAPIAEYGGNPVKAYVDLNGSIQWGGHIQTGDFTKSTGIIQIGGKELWGAWMPQRVATQDYSDATYPSGIDPAALIAQVLSDIQSPTLAGPGASIGLQVVAPGSDLGTVVPGYPSSQFTAIQQILSDMIALTVPGVGGLDITITSQWGTDGNPVDTLRVWSPRAGRVATQSGLIFDMLAAIDYTWDTDSSTYGNILFVTGAGSGPARPSTVVQSPGVPIGSLGQAPRLDLVKSYTSVQSQDQISVAANGVAQQFGKPIVTPTIKVATNDPRQPIGSWSIGDDARLINAGDERFPNGLDQYWRIVESSVAVADEGVSTATLTFNTPPIF